jgi:DnaJ domain
MSERMALLVAVDLLHVPSRVRFARSAPLPEGMSILLRIAAGDKEAERRAVELTDCSKDIVRQAATFFIEQILFTPDTDSYRVLGASQRATAGELRRNLALLSKWLHPDGNARNDRSVFIDRVTAAWNDVKTPERRAIYDERRGKEDQRAKRVGGTPVAIECHRAVPGRSFQRPHDAQKIQLFRLILSALFRRSL